MRADAEKHHARGERRHPTLTILKSRHVGSKRPSGRDLSDLSEELLSDLSALRVVDLEGLLGRLDERASDAAQPERGRQVSKLTDLSGEGFRGHAPDGT